MTAAARPIVLVACSVLRRLLLVPWLAVALSGCQSGPPLPPTSPEVVGEFRPGSGYLKGYLDRKQLPNSLALLPPPPREGSPQHGADLATYRDTRALRDQPRWTQAARDANLKFPAAAEVFACALDLPISQEATPHLNMLLRRSLLDAGRVIGAAAVARLHADPVFLAQAAAARKEIDEARAKGLRATRDCQAEAQALGR